MITIIISRVRTALANAALDLAYIRMEPVAHWYAGHEWRITEAKLDPGQREADIQRIEREPEPRSVRRARRHACALLALEEALRP